MRRASWDSSYVLGDYAFRFRTELDDLGEVLDDLFVAHRSIGVETETVYEAFRATSGAHNYTVTRDGAIRCRAQSYAAALDYVLWDVTRRTVEKTRYLAVHAGAVALGDRGVVLPASMDSGKTTLTAGLVRDGFSYFSDEAAFIDPASDLLHPFAKPLWMEARTLNLLGPLATSLPRGHLWMMKRNFHVAPDELRAGAIGEPCRVSHVIAPRYTGGTTTIESISKAEALMLLAENSFNSSHFGAEGFETLARIAEGADCYRLDVGELSDAVRIVREVVS